MKPQAAPMAAVSEAEKAARLAEVERDLDLMNKQMGKLDVEVIKAKDDLLRAANAAQRESNQVLLRELERKRLQLRMKMRPLFREKKLLSIPIISGGSHAEMKGKTERGFSESHHLVPVDSYEGLIDLTKDQGPSIWMHIDDHHATASHGNKTGASDYRREHAELVSQGKFMEAFQKEVEKLKELGLYERYKVGIKQAKDYLKKLMKNRKLFLPKVGAKKP